MPQISVIFRKVSGKPEAYLSQRIASLNLAGSFGNSPGSQRASSGQLKNYVEELSSALSQDLTPPLSAPVDFSVLDKGLAIRRDCMLSEIDRLFPAIDGEQTQKDTVHYLLEAWQGFPKQSIVLKRQTNLSECLYLYPNVLADPEAKKLEEPQLVRQGRQVLALSAASSVDFGAAAKTLADGLAGMLPPPLDVLGATLISAFWPSSDDATAQWQEIYNALQTLIKNGLAQNNVNVASAKLQGFVNFLDTEYKALKNTSTVTKQQLLDALAPYDTAFFLDIVNIFMYTNSSDEGIAAASLANFMTGACLHIGLNQERALEDPSVANPADSAYAKTVSNLATLYGNYATKTAPYVKQLRLAQISGVLSDSNTFCHGGPAAGCTTIYDYWFTDSNNGYRSQDYSYNSSEKNPPNAQGDAQAARNAYFNGISTQMDATLKTQVYDVVAAWNKLVANPVPSPVHQAALL